MAIRRYEPRPQLPDRPHGQLRHPAAVRVDPRTIRVGANTNLCVDADVSSGALYDGDKVQLYTCNGWSNQRWYWDGAYFHSDWGGNFCLAVNESGGAQSADGHKLYLTTCHSATNLRFSWNLDSSMILGATVVVTGPLSPRSRLRWSAEALRWLVLLTVFKP